MDWSFLSRSAKRLDQVVAIDLGARTTKAVHLQRRGEAYALSNFAVVPASPSESRYAPEVLAEHLKQVVKTLGNGHCKHAALALGVSDSIFRQLELPLMPLGDLRQMLKYNSKTYLQLELPDYVYDCVYCASATPVEGTKPAAPGQAKHKVMVVGAKRQVVEDVQAAAKSAGLNVVSIAPGLLGPVNAFETSEPQSFSKDVVALVDIGFRDATISVLHCGEIMLNRVVSVGGDRITAGLAEILNIPYEEAEGIKIGLSKEVQPQLEALLSPLGRELRASVDFFEHQYDKTVSQVYLSGGTACSEFIIQTLQTELIIPCKSWNPVQSLQNEVKPEKRAELEPVVPQLSVAIGTAMAVF